MEDAIQTRIFMIKEPCEKHSLHKAAPLDQQLCRHRRNSTSINCYKTASFTHQCPHIRYFTFKPKTSRQNPTGLCRKDTVGTVVSDRSTTTHRHLASKGGIQKYRASLFLPTMGSTTPLRDYFAALFFIEDKITLRVVPGQSRDPPDSFSSGLDFTAHQILAF